MPRIKDMSKDILTFRFPKRNLTHTQQKYLEYIEVFARQHGRLPTYGEIGKFFDRARSTVFESLNRGNLRYNSKTGVIIE